MEQVILGNLPNSSRVRGIARMRTQNARQQNARQSSNVKLTHTGPLTPDRPRFRTVLETVLAWLSPPQNIKSVLRSEGHFHLDRSFSVWK